MCSPYQTLTGAAWAGEAPASPEPASAAPAGRTALLGHRPAPVLDSDQGSSPRAAATPNRREPESVTAWLFMLSPLLRPHEPVACTPKPPHPLWRWNCSSLCGQVPPTRRTAGQGSRVRERAAHWFQSPSVGPPDFLCNSPISPGGACLYQPQFPTEVQRN